MKDNKYVGEVIWFDNRNNYGFIEWKDGVQLQQDLFVHFSDINCEGFKTLKKGQKVSFEIGKNNKGQPKAVNVIVL